MVYLSRPLRLNPHEVYLSRSLRISSWGGGSGLVVYLTKSLRLNSVLMVYLRRSLRLNSHGAPVWPHNRSLTTSLSSLSVNLKKNNDEDEGNQK